MKNLLVVKRDGRKAEFHKEKITNAILGAATEIGYSLSEEEAVLLTLKAKVLLDEKVEVSVEEIQNIVQRVLLMEGYEEVYNAYCTYRTERTKVREIKSDLMKAIDKIGVETDRDNANVGNNFSSKLLRIASESNKWHNLAVMPKHLAKLHENGDMYWHDLDSYNLTVNCLSIPTREVLERGFNPGYGAVKPPKRIESAAELACILMQSTQNDMFGGQSHPDFDNDLGIFVEPTRQEIRSELKEFGVPEEMIEAATEKKLRKTVAQAMQSIVYNLNTMASRTGSQVPFSSVNIGIPNTKDSALVAELFLIEYEKGLGNGEQPIFPNIIFRVKEGVNREKNDPYYYLFQSACKIAAKRMNPTFMNLDADFNKAYYDQGIVAATMGCRTYVMANCNGQVGNKGRGNIAPCTINLPRVGILAKGDLDKFFDLLDTRLEQGREALMHRYSILKKLRVKDLPFVAGQKIMLGSENLSPDDSIEPILRQGTYSIGYLGLAETLVALIGKHHAESEEARELGQRIITHIRNYTDKLIKETQLNWSTYATPAEGLSGKFILQDRKVFGVIPGVTDKEYYTNSYHVPVGFATSIVDKITIEAPYHKLNNAGHITYIELDDRPSGEVIEKILTYAYKNTNISYVGINFHIRYCRECGTYLSSGQTKCPHCGGHDIQGISRVTGYLSLDERFGAGKVAERADRISHTSSLRNY
jgi:anaerobic ribonucleoside-triphosphate reductase